jgi:hypothetical protein
MGISTYVADRHIPTSNSMVTLDSGNKIDAKGPQSENVP